MRALTSLTAIWLAAWLTVSAGLPQARQRQRFVEMFARAYFPGRSGQIFIVPKQHDVIVRLTEELQYMHGSPWEYDTHVPLLFYGPGFVRPGVYVSPAKLQDVAPTLAHWLGIYRDSHGRVRREIIRASARKPKLLATVMVDAGRYDYFDRFAAQLPAIQKMRRAGAWFNNCRLNYAPTVTAVAHAVIGSGYDPRRTGMVVNSVYSFQTRKYENIWPENSPVNLEALTLADQWNLESGGKAVIIAQGGAFYAAGGMVGHGACLQNASKVIAYGYGEDTGKWVSHASCYVLPAYLEGMDARQYWERAGGRWRGHDIASPRRFRPSAIFGVFETDALMKVLEREPIGQDAVTDLLMVNFKMPDYVAHKFGPDSDEIAQAMSVLNGFFERLRQVLEERAGRDGFVLVVSADHGMPQAPERIGRRRVSEAEVLKTARDRFGKEVVLAFQDSNLQLVVDRDELARRGLSLKEIAVYLESLDYIEYAFTEDEVRQAVGRILNEEIRAAVRERTRR